MKKKILFYIIIIFLFSQQVFALKLSEALLMAYKENIILNAERENINISKENINISKSQFLPTMTITGTKSKENTSKLTNQSNISQSMNDVDPLVKTFLIEQTLYDGKARGNDLEKNKLGLDLAKIKVLKVEQDTLFKAIEAYTGLTLANQKLFINKINLDLLSRQVENDKARLERGRITIVDLAQSESSLAEAQARLIEAENNIIISKLIYENIIGNVTLKTFKENIDIFPTIPKSLSVANKISIKNNPDLIISKLEYEQSKKDIKIANSYLLPSATLSFEASQSEDLSVTYNEREKTTLKATIKWPFYTGGKNRSIINKNKNINNQKKLLMSNATKANKTNVTSAWSNLQSSKSFLDSIKSQVKAAKIANDGIKAEYELGNGRSTLDVIQSNTILLNAKITLADSERNYLLAKFKLLQKIGLLNIKYLKI
jgi:outer membrane protein